MNRSTAFETAFARARVPSISSARPSLMAAAAVLFQDVRFKRRLRVYGWVDLRSIGGHTLERPHGSAATSRSLRLLGHIVAGASSMDMYAEWSKYIPEIPALPEGKQWHVLISYRYIHRTWVLQLYDALVQLGIKSLARPICYQTQR